MPVDYQEGKIYKIYNTINDDIYVGSTTQKLCERMRHHRCSISQSTEGNRLIHKAFIDLGVKNFFIELIEKYPCNDKDELRKKEGEYISALKPSLNMLIAGRTRKESTKEFQQNNREYMLEYKKQYNEANKERIAAHRSETITCECGCIVTKPHLPRHKRSAKHNQLMNE